MRFLLFFAFPLFALDSAYILTAVSTATGTVQVAQVNFDCGAPGAAQGSLPVGKWTAPYVSGTKLTTWQNDVESWCSNGSIEHVIVSFQFTAAANTPTTVQFRADDNPCSSGNRAACDAAGLNQAGMLAFNGGTWTASMVVTPNPLGSATAATFDARAVLTAGRWSYRLRGPAITQVIVGDTSTSRLDDFGWKQHTVAILAAQIDNGTQTSFTVNDASQWSAISRPFRVSMANGSGGSWETMIVCYVSGNTLYTGNSNGSDASCANTNGRGADGTTAAAHTVGLNGVLVVLREAGDNYIASGSLSTGQTSVTIDDASAISAVTLFQVGGTEIIRVCNKSGNVLTIGKDAWGCSANAEGRGRRGTDCGFGDCSHFWGPGVPVRAIEAVTDRWRNAPSDQFKSLHPTALLSFPVGWAGVNVQFRIENTWMDRLQSLEYDVAINTSAYTRTGVKQSARQMLHFPVYDDSTPGLRGLWVGSKPTSVEFDFNLKWCVAIGICPDDPDVSIAESNVSDLLDNSYVSNSSTAPSWTGGSNSKCEADTIAIFDGANRGSYGPFTRLTNDGGARVDVGFKPKFSAMATQAWKLTGAVSRTMREAMGSLYGCGGIMPIHYMENSNSLSFCDGGGYTANTADKACTTAPEQALTTFGFFPSIIAYPSINPHYQNNGTPRVRPVGAVDANGIIAYIPGAWSHMPANPFWDWIVSGNYFVEEVIISQAGNAIAGSNAYPGASAGLPNSTRNAMRGSFAAVNTADGARSRAWPIRDMFFGWYAARSGTARRQYLDWALRMNFGVLEGAYDWAGGAQYTPCQGGASSTNLSDISYSPWCYGRQTRGLAGTMNPLWPSEPGIGYNTSGNVNAIRAKSLLGTFMASYEMISYGQIGKKLPAAAPFAREYAARIITQRMLGSGGNPWALSTFQLANDTCIPEGQDVPTCSSQTNAINTTQGFSTVANWLAAASSATQAMTAPDMSSGPQSRSIILRGLMRVNPRADFGTLTARRAREFWDQIPQQNTLADVRTDPSWAYALWERPTIAVTPGDTTAKFSASTLWAACKVATQTTPFTLLDDASHSAGSMVGQRLEHAITGLTAATTYYYMVTCGDLGRTLGTFTTTASAGGSTTRSFNLAAPSGRGIATARIAYGSSASLGSNATASCATTCSVDVTANFGRALFWRVEWLDGSNNLIARGAIHNEIP